jgi:glutathione S-transferase
MKLYWGPHTCAIGIHILLEEIGEPYETEKIDTAGGQTRQPPFMAVNPKGKVPTLIRDDGSVLTEFSAIATWLARTNPRANLLPDDPEIEARAVEAMAYVEGTIHGQGFARVFVPQMFEPQDVTTLGLGKASVERQGRELVETGFAILDPQLGRSPTSPVTCSRLRLRCSCACKEKSCVSPSMDGRLRLNSICGLRCSTSCAIILG